MLTIKSFINKVIAKRVASIFTLSVLFIALFYVLFSPALIANPLPSFSDLTSSPNAMAATTDDVVVSVVVGKEVSVTAPADFTLTGTILGVSGGTASGSATFQVLNSSQAGFNMSLKASTAPALATGSYFFSDYSTNAVTGTPTYNWTAPSAGTASFSFSVIADAAASANQKFKYSGSACNAAGGSNSGSFCWSGFVGTTDIPVISTSSFSAATVSESFVFKASYTQGGGALASDTYRATITATVATN